MSIQSVLVSTGLPVAYGRFKKKQNLPYLVYIGAGQDNFPADDTFYHSENSYQIELYYSKKDEEVESAIEAALLEGGYLYEKSEDVYVEDEDIWMIYYTT